MKLNMTPTVKSLTGSKKRDFNLDARNTVAPRTGWSGGSCESHLLVRYAGAGPLQALVCGDQFSRQTVNQELPPGCVMVTTSVFCGKPGWPVITCREDEVAAVRQWLGVPSESPVAAPVV